MKLPGQWDVLIVGGGPAGSLSGYHLAKAGLRVAILDLRRFPRVKACGGGIQLRASRWIPFPWSSVVKSTIHSAQFSFQFRERFQRKTTQPIVHCVLRAEFDEMLLRTAEMAGVHVFEGVRTHSVIAAADGVTVQTTQGEMRARYVIGADGANSVVSRVLNSRSDFFWQVAIYLELEEGKLTSRIQEANAIRIDLGSLPSGYAWVFPKGDQVNIGAGCPAVVGKHLKQYFRRFLAEEKLASTKVLDSMSVHGHQLPTLTSKTKVAKSNLFLVGDAAGLVEPLTGEGISYACHSAEAAARSLVDWFDRPEAELQYKQAITQEVGCEILWARRLLALAVSFPRIFYRLIQHQESLWKEFCDVLRGDGSFQRLYREVLGPLAHVHGPIDFFSRKIEEKRLLVSKLSEALGKA
ncbi:MAG: geranylgeranyl reductase family protein [Acidobacteria bacterium]|nr:geranylgeranyl reductase family protein [Acidobacteriota bacterium]